MEILGNDLEFKGNGIVAFIDILGFAKEIEEKWNDIEDNPLEKILKLKSTVHENVTNAKIPEQVGKHDKLFRCRVQTISDSFIVSMDMPDNIPYVESQRRILTTFEYIRTIWRNVIDAGFTVRGGVDFGPICWNINEIIGPAFITAYQLELNTAKTSRIVLSSGLNKQIAHFAEEAKYTQCDFEFGFLLELRKDVDGYLIINPHMLYGGKNEGTEVETKDYYYIIQQLENLKEKASLQNKLKYTGLLAVLSSDKFNLSESNFGQY